MVLFYVFHKLQRVHETTYNLLGNNFQSNENIMETILYVTILKSIFENHTLYTEKH